MQEKIKKFWLVLFLAIGYLARAETTLVGSLIIKKGESYSYKVSFSTNVEGKLKGYSVTDLGGNSETKSGIEGYYDSLKRELRFREISVLSSKAKIKKNQSFCFVNVRLKGKIGAEQVLYQGKFTGYMNDSKQECAKGEISLVDRKSIINLLQKQEGKNEMITILKNKLLQEGDNREEVPILSAEKAVQLPWKGKNMSIKVWDDGQFDEDKIAIVLNGEKIIPLVILNNQPQLFSISLKDGANVLEIVALNEGAITPNSAKVSLSSSTNEAYTFLSYNTKGKSSRIEITME